MAAYVIDGQRLTPDQAGYVDALAAAHAKRRRPLCQCRLPAPAMYVAHLGTTFIVKRMPGTGRLHAPGCPSHDPPGSALPRAAETATEEHPDSGTTFLKLDFALSRFDRRVESSVGADRKSAAPRSGRGLTLQELLRYLWLRAGLTRAPVPGERRSWSTLRQDLLAAAAVTVVCGRSLRDVLYIPEAFDLERREEIVARRTAQWGEDAQHRNQGQTLMLLLGEAKRFPPTRYANHLAIVKHVPDRTFLLRGSLHALMSKRFKHPLSLWTASETARMLILATFAPRHTGVLPIEDVALLGVSAQWMPLDDAPTCSLKASSTAGMQAAR